MMKYYQKIDGLRFVAILLVLFEHFGPVTLYFKPGFYGVDLFFVISGFLITKILITENDRTFQQNYLRFIWRRTVRIFPIYYLAIIILWLLDLGVVRDYWFYFVTYSFNYAWVYYHISLSPVSHFWSLCVEEQFYLFWPFLILALKNKPKLLLLIIAVVVLIGYCQSSFDLIPGLKPYNSVSLLSNMSSLGLGGFGALFATLRILPKKIFTNKLLEYFFLALTAASVFFRWKLLMDICSMYLIYKAAYFNFSIKAIERFLSNKYIMYIGTISYGIYIYHMAIGYYFTKYLFDPIWLNINFHALGRFEKLRFNSWLIKLPLYPVLSIITASLSFKYFEKPILKLKEKFS